MTHDLPPPTVRPATDDDIEFMVQMYLDLAHQRHPGGKGADLDAITHGTRHATLEQVQGRVPHSVTYVIEREGQRVGRLRVVRNGLCIEIPGLQVLPSAQNRGIGTFVVSELVEEGVAAALPVVLQVDKDNLDARRLYDRLGFEPFEETDQTIWMMAPNGRTQDEGRRTEART